MNEERVRQTSAAKSGSEAVEHLQRAALELIDAARAVLDVAEEFVREPAGMTSVVASFVGTVAKDARPPEEPPSTVTRIRVS